VAVLRRDGHVAYFAAGVPLFTHRDADAVGQRIAAVQLMELRSWLHDHRQQLEPRPRWLDRRRDGKQVNAPAPLSLMEAAKLYRRPR
jgi:hypothetical protein